MVMMHPPPHQLQEVTGGDLAGLKASSDTPLLAALLSLQVRVSQLDTDLHMPGKRESQLKNCIHQTGLWAHLGSTFFCWLYKKSTEQAW